MEKYTGKIFKIKLRFIKQNIPMYKLQDLNEEELVGSFYQAELQKVEKPEETLWEVEKIVSKRRRNKKNMVLVKWLNFPSSFNSWIPCRKRFARSFLMDFYAVVSDGDFLQCYPNNTPNDFRIHLPRMNLKGQWYVGLCETTLTVDRNCEVCIFLDICGDTLINGEKNHY